MNVYQKLNAARIDLQGLQIKATGENKFAGYKYLDLADLIPHINRILAEKELCAVLSFSADAATLQVVDCDKPESFINFTSPMSSAALKGCHDVQNLGAVQTYLRRYLYVAAMEIVEHDALDATMGKIDKPEVKKDKPLTDSQGRDLSVPCFLSEAQMKKLFATLKDSGVDAEIFKAHFEVSSSKDFPASRFSEALNWLDEQKKINDMKKAA